MSNILYKVIKDSGELGMNLEDGQFQIGERVLQNLTSQDEVKVIGARKRFTHEYWHYLFANMSSEQQKSLTDSLKSNVISNSELKLALQEFSQLLYLGENSYDFHFPTLGNEDLFVGDNKFGIKVVDEVELPFDGQSRIVYGALFLTELLSLSSESEFENIDEYYTKVEPTDATEHKLWERKKRLGELARSIVQELDNPLIVTELKDHTKEGLTELDRIGTEFKRTDSVEPTGVNRV